MTRDSLHRNFRQLGIWGGAAHYLARGAYKLQLHVIGVWTRRRSARENRIVFKNAQFQDYRDNTRALSDYLIERGYNRKYEIVWMVSDKKKYRHILIPNVKFVTAENRYGWSSPAACWYGMTAKYFFFTHNSAELNRYHCSNQIVINLWHGCGYKKNNNQQANHTAAFDYALVPGPLFIPAKAEFWNCPRENICTLGYPRYDWMLRPNPGRETVIKLLAGSEDIGQKLVLWMPTFRKSKNPELGDEDLPYDLPGLSSDDDLRSLDSFCTEANILLFVIKHPFQIAWSIKGVFSNIQFVDDQDLEKKGILLYSLLGHCDALISDYSSVAVDYLLLNRPMAFVLADYEQYRQSRGFVFENPTEYMPGEKLFSPDDFKRFLGHVADGYDPFREERVRMLPKMHNRTKNYCERLTEYLNL